MAKNFPLEFRTKTASHVIAVILCVLLLVVSAASCCEKSVVILINVIFLNY